MSVTSAASGFVHRHSPAATTLALAVATQLALTGAGITPPAKDRLDLNSGGPSTICGITGSNAVDLIGKIKNEPSLVVVNVNSDRFEAYSSRDQVSFSWVFTRAADPAYPSITCRHVYQDNGSIVQTREMRCDASYAECDALFAEFRQLDEQARQAVAAGMHR